MTVSLVTCKTIRVSEVYIHPLYSILIPLDHLFPVLSQILVSKTMSFSLFADRIRQTVQSLQRANVIRMGTYLPYSRLLSRISQQEEIVL